jgi:putative ABC transport system substrate-binding protein
VGVNDAFLEAMRDLGWLAGQNVSYEVRSADGKLDRLPQLAAELVRLKVDLIYATAPPQVSCSHAGHYDNPDRLFSGGGPRGGWICGKSQLREGL